MRLSFEEIQKEIKRVFIKYGMGEEKAEICARIHTESTYDGIYSHGTGRVARFAEYLRKGWVDPLYRFWAVPFAALAQPGICRYNERCIHENLTEREGSL